MISINPYIVFQGKCKEAFAFYQTVFGGEIPHISLFKDMPPDPARPVPEAEKDLVLHMSLVINPHAILMGSDTSDSFGGAIKIGDNVSLSINSNSKEEVDTLWGKLMEGGKVVMPLQKTFWGDYFSMGVDKYNINWMISFAMEKK